MTAIELGAIAAAAVAGLMFVLWLIHLAIRNASIVDPGWAIGTASTAAIYGALGPGLLLRRQLIAAMAVFWGIRLALHLLGRIVGHPEEGRYVQLRQEWGSRVELKFLAFFLFQAALCVILSAPFLAAAMNPAPELSLLEYAGLGLFAAAVIGESVADWQLNRFKSKPASKGKTCREGLWRYSRHPNYFFEWMIWAAWAVFALASPGGWIGLLSPALMLYFLFRVTGIPATEAQSLRTKGDDYREYQRTTSAFVPLPPRA